MADPRTVLRLAADVSPELAGALALRAFANSQPRLALREADAATQDAASRSVLRVRGKDVVAYRWGRGDETVLLVHGWRGRASQFAPLVRELVADGLHVVSFDAPAHGASPYSRTDIRDWIAAIEALQQQHGRFRMLVGHSFGALAALTAARSGVTTVRLATIAGAGTPRVLLDQFAAMLQLDPRVRASFERRFRTRLGEDEDSMWQRFDAVGHPLPPHVELLSIHDRGDAQVPFDASVALVEAHAGRALLVPTSGLGHNRILGADTTLDAVTAHARGGLTRVEEVRTDASR